MQHSDINRIFSRSEKNVGAMESGDFVWATSEVARQQAETLHLIGSIVHKHGGTLKVKSGSDSLHIDVPDEKKVACAMELQERAGLTLN